MPPSGSRSSRPIERRAGPASIRASCAICATHATGDQLAEGRRLVLVLGAWAWPRSDPGLGQRTGTKSGHRPYNRCRASRDRRAQAPRFRHRHLHPESAAASRAHRHPDRIRAALPASRTWTRRRSSARTSAPCSSRRRTTRFANRFTCRGCCSGSGRMCITRRTTCCRRPSAAARW